MKQYFQLIFQNNFYLDESIMSLFVLYAVRYAGNNDHLEVTKVLIDAGADLHAFEDEILPKICNQKQFFTFSKTILERGILERDLKKTKKGFEPEELEKKSQKNQYTNKMNFSRVKTKKYP